MSTLVPGSLKVQLPDDARFAIVAARFNSDIVDQLHAGCTRQFATLGVAAARVETFYVPGAFELPLAAQWAAQTRRFAGVVCMGAVIRGDTPHFEYVAGECARGIQRVSLESGVPVIFGVLTVNTIEQALARVGGSHGHAGERAADAAVEMASLREALRAK